MGSRLFLQIPVKRRKNASRISRPCTMHTSMPNKRDLGVLSVRTIYKRRGSATRRRRIGVRWGLRRGTGTHQKASQSLPLGDRREVRKPMRRWAERREGVGEGKAAVSSATRGGGRDD